MEEDRHEYWIGYIVRKNMLCCVLGCRLSTEDYSQLIKSSSILFRHNAQAVA